MLKLLKKEDRKKTDGPAAFGRLRVETADGLKAKRLQAPAAFGRLRVETKPARQTGSICRPAAFGRLRVETETQGVGKSTFGASRLRAAAC